MAIDKPVYELIERYLSNEMEPAEQQSFEAALNSDPKLMETLLAYKKLNDEYLEIEQSKEEEEALAGTLKQMSRKFFPAEKKITKNPAPVRKMVFAVAAAASIIAAFFLLKPVLSGTGNKDLFDKYYPEEQFPISRGATDSATRAGELYNAKDYAGALNMLEPYTKNHRDKSELQIFAGRSYLQTGKYAEADSVFALVAGGGAALFREKAQYLRVFALLKQNNKEEARKKLNAIPPQSFYYKQAQEMLGKL